MRPEQALHQQVAQYLAWALAPPAFFTTFPAGGGGEMRGKILRSIGMVAGFPDLILFHDSHAYGIELKSRVGILSAAQRRVHKALQEAGIPVIVARSLDEVRGALWAWQLPMREQKPVAKIIVALADDLPRHSVARDHTQPASANALVRPPSRSTRHP